MDTARNIWMNAGTVTPEKGKFVISKLYEDNEYKFRVAALNAVGVGEFMEIEAPVKASLPFCKYILIDHFSLIVLVIIKIKHKNTKVHVYNLHFYE